MKREAGIKDKLEYSYIFLESGARPKAFKVSSTNLRKSKEMQEFLEQSRWAQCILAKGCVDATQKFFGFSCEDCPLRGEPRYSF